MPEPSQELSGVLARASELAGVRWIGTADFVQALEASAEAVEVLRRCGIGSADVQAAVAAAVATEPREGEQTDDEPLGGPLRAATTMAQRSALSADRRSYRSTDVLGALLMMTPAPAVAAELRRRGLSVLRLRRVAVHGLADYTLDAPPPGETCAVCLHDDPFTTREFVVHALTQIFLLEERVAVKLMLATHESGGATFGPLPTARARECVERTHRSAAEQDFPMRLTLGEPERVDEVVTERADTPVAEPDGLAWERAADDDADRDGDGASRRMRWVVTLVLAAAVLALLFR